MGNQQERSFSWLAGILDGEGSISVQVYTLPNGRIRCTPFLSVINSDELILKEVERIYADIGVVSRRCAHARVQHEKSFQGKKPCYSIRVDGYEPVIKALDILTQYLRGEKQTNARVVLQFCKERVEGLLVRGDKGRITRAPYTKAQIDLISSIRRHSKAKSSETICQAPNVVG